MVVLYPFFRNKKVFIFGMNSPRKAKTDSIAINKGIK